MRWHDPTIGAVLSSVSGRQGRSEILPRRLDRRGGASVVRRPPRGVAATRVATWWRYRLEYRKRQIGLVHNLTQSQYVIGAPEEIRTPDPQIRSLVTPITQSISTLFWNLLAARCIMACRLKRPRLWMEMIKAARGRARELTVHSWNLFGTFGRASMSVVWRSK